MPAAHTPHPEAAVMDMRRALIAGATALAVAAAGSASPAVATITSCGRVTGTQYSFRVITHGETASSCRTARRVARRTVGSQIDRPLRVWGWSCIADYYDGGPWSFLCIRRRTYGQVSIDHFRRLPDRRSTLAGDIFGEFHCENDENVEMGDWLIVVGRWLGRQRQWRANRSP
jgi:hypothetical protein